MDQNAQHTTFEAPSLEEISKKIKGYDFECFIAKGGMGAVYLATQITLERPVAIKILPPEFGDDPGFRASFQEEAKMMARLNHPNLVAIYDFGDIDGMLYIIMEYVQGKTLYHSANGKSIKPRLAAGIVHDIAMGLAHAHDSSILHRDIKPGNILLSSDRKAKISDFGLARLSENTESGIIFGTPGYTAPEVVKSPQSVGPQADIFSVGVILYELLSGKQPEKAYIPISSMIKADPGFDNIIRKAIHPSPRMRYRNAHDLADDLHDLIKDIEAAPDKKVAVPKSILATGPAVATGSSKLMTASSPASNAATKSAKLTKTATAAPQLKPHPRPEGAAVPAAVKAVTPGASALASPDAPAPGASGAPALATPAEPALGAMGLPAPASVAINQKDANAPIVRNLIIIIILLAAIYVAYDRYALRKAEVTEINNRPAPTQPQPQQPRQKPATQNPTKNPNTTPKQPNKPKINTTVKGSGIDHSKHTDTPELVNKEETSFDKAFEQLKEIIRDLRAGKIEAAKLPNNTQKRGAQFVLFIDKPMTWHEADEWCEYYGGQLAAAPTKADLYFLNSHAKKDTNYWTGGASAAGSKWRWISGQDWRMNVHNVTGTSGVLVSGNGIPRPEKMQTKLPFYIQWYSHGSNIGNINNRLLTTFLTLDEINPTYPASSFKANSRTYVVVHRPMTRARAQLFAQHAGGQLATISDKHELEDITEHIKTSVGAGKKIWINGLQKDGKWNNYTPGANDAEPWRKMPWDVLPTAKQNACALLAGDEIKATAVSSKEVLPAFLIEWSSDLDRHRDRNVQLTPVQSLVELNTQLGKTVETELMHQEAERRASFRRAIWSVDTWLKSRKYNEKSKYRPALTSYKQKLITAKELNDDISTANLPEDAQMAILGIVSHRGTRENLHKRRISKLRDNYLIQLRALRTRLRKHPSKQEEYKAVEACYKKHEKAPQDFLKLAQEK